MPNYLYEKTCEDSECVRIMGEEGIDAPEGWAQVRRHVSYNSWLVEDIRSASSLPEQGDHTQCVHCSEYDVGRGLCPLSGGPGPQSCMHLGYRFIMASRKADAKA